MPCFCLREPIKISLYLFFSIFWNFNMITNSFEIFFISFKNNKIEIQVFFFFQCIISKQKHKTKLENFQLKIETIYLEIFTSEMDFLNSTVYYMYYYLDSTAILNFFHIWSAAVTIQYICLFYVVANIIKEWEITFSTHWDTMFIYRSYVCFLSVTSSIENSIFIHQEFKMESFITDSLWETGRKLGMGVYIIIFFYH